MRKSPAWILFGLVFLMSCTRPVKLQPLPLDHPANPKAPEATMQAPVKTLREGPDVATKAAEAPGPAHSMHHNRRMMPGENTGHPPTQPGSTLKRSYLCPTHSKVKAAAPGRCPKCGMTLKKEREK